MSKEKKTGNHSIMKVILVFMILCVLCSMVLNIFLYRRMIRLEQSIKDLSCGSVMQVTQEV